MSDGFPLRPLGEVMRLDITTVQVDPESTYEIVGVLNRGRGLLYRDPISGTATSYKTLNLVGPDVVVYSRLKAFEGAITVTPSGLDVAYASPEFPTFRCNESLSPEYFRLVTTTPSLWEALRRASKGMGGRRERVKPADFLEISVPVPPTTVQERIVEVIGAVDDQIAALDAEAAAGALVRSGLIDGLIATHAAGEVKTLGDFGAFERGRRFTKTDYVDSGIGCIHYGQIYTDYGAVATETVSYLPESFRSRMRLAHSGDLVVAGTGENTEEIGKAVAWLGDDDVAVHDDAYIYRHSLDPAYAAAVFASSEFLRQRVPSDSKVARLSAKDLAKIAVPVVPLTAQVQIGNAMVAFDERTDAIRQESDRLRTVRASLLSALLNREIEIAKAERTVA